MKTIIISSGNVGNKVANTKRSNKTVNENTYAYNSCKMCDKILSDCTKCTIKYS
jgi:hypothetical protein